MMPPEDPNMVPADLEETAPPLADDSIYPSHHPEPRGRSKYWMATVIRYKYYLGVATLVVILIISLSIGLAKSGGGGGSTSTTPAEVPYTPASPPDDTPVVVDTTPEAPETPSTPVDDVTQLEARMADLLSRLLSIYNVLEFPENYGSRFENTDSPQFRALKWVCSESIYVNLSASRRLQRFALASFFYSTYAVKNAYVTSQVPWTSATLWLSEDHECTWEGISCFKNHDTSSGNVGEQVVIGIDLKQHRLSGGIPRDLALLRESLTSLILTNNLIYMEGGDIHLFRHLDNLQTLALDDNYIVEHNGLPSSIKQLANLEKLVMSYNLLQGTIPNTFFNDMTKLTHLEIESNYLSGTLPASLLKMKTLIYLYLRRNEFYIPLGQELKRADWPNIFSLWMDHNNVTGIFPTEIGQFTGLASLSITNTSLWGEIPTEIGLLTGLRRAWFYGNYLSGKIPEEVGYLDKLEVFEVYGNYLSGKMPSGVCDAVSEATYEYKQLSADCDSVNCNNCCTVCY